VQGGHTVGGEVVEHAREELVEDPRAGDEQPVGVASLGDATPGLRRIRQLVAFDHGHPRERVRQHASGQEAGHARAEDHRMLADGRSGRVHASTGPRSMKMR
jgi:hypothetical protein